MAGSQRTRLVRLNPIGTGTHRPLISALMDVAEQKIVDTFIRDGRLVTMPTKRGKMLVVLAYLAQ